MTATFDDFRDMPPLARTHLMALEIFIGDIEGGSDFVTDEAVESINALAKMIRTGCTGQSCEHCEPGTGCDQKS